MNAQPKNKICSTCGRDVADLPRTKDNAGRYFCAPCWQGKMVSAQSSATAATLPSPKPSADNQDDLYDLASLVPSPANPPMHRCHDCRGMFDQGDVYSDNGLIVCRRCAADQPHSTPSTRTRAATTMGRLPYATPMSSASAEDSASHRGKAITAMVLSLVGLFSFCFSFVLGLLAIIFASLALSGMSRSDNKAGKGMAVTGLVIGIIDVVVGLIISLAVLASKN